MRWSHSNTTNTGASDSQGHNTYLNETKMRDNMELLDIVKSQIQSVEDDIDEEVDTEEDIERKRKRLKILNKSLDKVYKNLDEML